jgi:hypothetical protein
MNVWFRPGLVVQAAASLAACNHTKVATSPPPPSPAYAKVMGAATASPGRGQCLNEAEAQTVRGRILQQELAYASRACNMTAEYNQFASKFGSDLGRNGNELGVLLRKRGIAINAFVTDVANKAATRATSYPGFCADAREAFRWALQPSTTQLAAVPPLFDNTADHSTKPCIQPQIRR